MLITNLVDAYHKFGGGCLAQTLVVDAHNFGGGCLSQTWMLSTIWMLVTFGEEVLSLRKYVNFGEEVLSLRSLSNSILEKTEDI